MKEIMKKEKQEMKKTKKGKHNVNDDQQDNTDGFHIDVADPRFTAMHDSHLYALDPTNPQFKKTKATEALLEERRKRHNDHGDTNDVMDLKVAMNGSLGMKNSSLSNLVDSVSFYH